MPSVLIPVIRTLLYEPLVTASPVTILEPVTILIDDVTYPCDNSGYVKLLVTNDRVSPPGNEPEILTHVGLSK